MRPFKFRAIDKKTRKYIYSDKVGITAFWSKWFQGELKDVQEYSGLNDDKSEVEIYERDTIIGVPIVGADWMLPLELRKNNFYRGTVIFDKGCFCLKIERVPNQRGFTDIYDIDQTPELYKFMYKEVILRDQSD